MARDKNLFSKIMIGFGFIMVAVFIGIGTSLIFLPIYTYLPPNVKPILGFCFIVYGLFRLARLFQQIKEQKRKEYDDE